MLEHCKTKDFFGGCNCIYLYIPLNTRFGYSNLGFGVCFVLICSRTEKSLQVYGKKCGNVLARFECRHTVQTYTPLVSCLLRQGFKQSLASLQLACSWAKGIKGVGRSPGTRVAVEILLMLINKVQGKGVRFQIVRKFGVARHYELF